MLAACIDLTTVCEKMFLSHPGFQLGTDVCSFLLYKGFDDKLPDGSIC